MKAQARALWISGDVAMGLSALGDPHKICNAVVGFVASLCGIRLVQPSC